MSLKRHSAEKPYRKAQQISEKTKCASHLYQSKTDIRVQSVSAWEQPGIWNLQLISWFASQILPCLKPLTLAVCQRRTQNFRFCHKHTSIFKKRASKRGHATLAHNANLRWGLTSSKTRNSSSIEGFPTRISLYLWRKPFQNSLSKPRQRSELTSTRNADRSEHELVHLRAQSLWALCRWKNWRNRCVVWRGRGLWEMQVEVSTCPIIQSCDLIFELTRFYTHALLVTRTFRKQLNTTNSHIPPATLP